MHPAPLPANFRFPGRAVPGVWPRLTGASKVTLDIPYDHAATFAPKLDAKYQCRFRGGSGNLNSGDKWIAGLTAAMLAASRRQDEQATPPEPQPGVQGQGGVGCREGREDAGRVGAAV